MKLKFKDYSYTVEELRNKRNQVIAKIYTKQGISILKDIKGKKLGSYNSKENKTRDVNGVLVDYGNWLVALLFDYNNLTM